jgi:hypothetical protein
VSSDRVKRHMLSSNALGEKGQSRFKELCADADLICNKSDRDMAGWDFVVDFDLDESASTSLDHRKTPLSFHVQLKTIYDRTTSVKLSLKMAERLAKELKPSFICVLKVDSNLCFTDAYLIHMSGDHVGRVLKRLREAGAKASSTKIREMTISFTQKESERIGLSGSALRDAMVRYVGRDLHSYSERKRIELQDMGYEALPHKGRFEIDVEDLATFQDMFVGLTGEVDIKNFEMLTTRFGVTLPETSSATAKISLVANPVDTFSVVFRNRTSNETASFEGDAFFSPDVPGIERRIHIKCKLVSIFRKFGDESAAVSLSFDAKGKVCSLDEWSNYWKMMRLIQSKTASVEIKSLNHPSYAEIYIGEQAGFNPGTSSVETCVTLCDELAEVLKFAGVKQDLSFSFSSITAQLQLVEFLAGMINGTDETVYKRNFQASEEHSQSFQGDGLVAGKLVIENLILAYYARVMIETTFDDGVCTVTATNFQIKKARRIRDAEADFQDFVASAKKAESVEIVLSI